MALYDRPLYRLIILPEGACDREYDEQQRDGLYEQKRK